MGMGFAPTRLRQVSPPPSMLLHMTTLTIEVAGRRARLVLGRATLSVRSVCDSPCRWRYEAESQLVYKPELSTEAVIDLPNRTETGSGFSGLARSVCRIRIQFHET